MSNPEPNFRALCNGLLDALDDVQDWEGTRVGDAMDALEAALATEPQAPDAEDNCYAMFPDLDP